MPNIPPIVPDAPRPVVLFAFEGVQILDVAGPLQALTTANDEGASPRYEPVVAAMKPGVVRTASGVGIEAQARDSLQDRFDTFIIPGGPGVHPACESEETVEMVRTLASHAVRVCSVCTGAFLAARAGLLDGKRVVTHWRSCALLAREYPLVEVEPDPIFLRDGNLWSSAGVTAGIDLALALVEEDHGRELAARVARRLVVYLRRPGGQSQFSEPLAVQTLAASPYSELLEKVALDPGREWSVERMADLACQSVRTFHRLFRGATGRTPAQAVEDIRFERARILLETTSLSLKEIASQSGLGGEETMRRLFQRRLSTSPNEMRRRFGLS